MERLDSERRRMTTFPAADDARKEGGYMIVDFELYPAGGSNATPRPRRQPAKKNPAGISSAS